MKEIKSCDDLAVFGAVPLFKETLHVGRPNIGDRGRFHDLVDEMFDRRWLSNDGPFLKALEERLKAVAGTKHCILVCNATIGLDLAFRAAGLAGEVILPSFTFIASAHALAWQGIKPVFCDIDPETHNIDPDKLEPLITPQTAAILGVHVWGRPCAINALESIAAKNDLKLVFDAAHAFGCTYQGKPVGSFGDAEVFSFHATKFFNTFEGGMISTDDDDLAERIRLLRNFGFSGKDSVISIGTNGKMSEVSAAMGLVGLDSLEEFIRVNRRNYLAYQEALRDLPSIKLIRFDEDEKNNYQYVILEVDVRAAGVDRDRLVEILSAENILARRYFFPGCHEMEPYRSNYPDSKTLLPETEKLTRKVMSLPTGTAVSTADIEKIGSLIRFVIANSSEIKDRYDDLEPS